MKFFGVAEFSCLPVNDSRARAMWHYIANGVIEDESWYRALNQTNADQNIHDYIEERRQQENTENVINTPIDNIEVDSNNIEMNSVDESSDQPEDNTDKIQNLLENTQKLNDKMISKLSDIVSKKALIKFSKFIKGLYNASDETRNRKIFDICSESKKKIGNTIRVQPTSISRHKNKNRGRGASSCGRRVQNTALRTQLDVEEDHIMHHIIKTLDLTGLYMTCKEQSMKIVAMLKSIK